MTNQNLKNKIEAEDTTIKDLLKEQKFTIDYFQREYRWEERHIKQLLEDLTNAFFKSYQSQHTGPEAREYQGYYLGSVVFNINTDTNKKSIIDGQQRITSITLLLIYLHHRLKRIDCTEVPVSEMIYSSKYFEKSFNMEDETREPCIKALFEKNEYEAKEDDNETVRNIAARYEDIGNLFPEEINDQALPIFVVWLIEKVILVQIIAYSEDNAYVIFETMNDRGLNLTPTEMLKGFVLSKITDKKERDEINVLWKKQIEKLHAYGNNADQSFFQAWFRSKYAGSMRPGKIEAENQDFENIALRYHNWFKENHQSLFNLNSSDDFYLFFKSEFPFFVSVYTKIKDAYDTYTSSMRHLHYIYYWGIAESLQEPLLFAAVNPSDSSDMVSAKLDMVARFIETFTVRRSINYRKFSQTSIKYKMFGVIKKLRNNSLSELADNLKSEIELIPEGWDGIDDFCLHGQNRNFIKHLLSRISGYIDAEIGKDSHYVSYHHPEGRHFQIEHIWADNFGEHRDEFEQKEDFQDWRNSIGALLLLPQGSNQSYNDDPYEDKLKHYIKENAYAQTLHPQFYEKNPNFLNSEAIRDIGFKPHPQFKTQDIVERNGVVMRICMQIWDSAWFHKVIES